MSEQQLSDQTEAALADAPAAGGPLVGIIMGSASDMPLMEKAGTVLREAEVEFEIEVMSAHRDPVRVAEYCTAARSRGLKVIIAGAGLAAALPGVAAAHTDLPVIGVPLSSSLSALGGLDAVLAIVQMPPGVPVATVGLDNPKNAAHLAVRILGIT
ncbi:N5-carboxyaminoimidazole ribonucleotide mutase [Paraconexibacter sp. AEG42_29]|uniref:N5-carboxyaminoimidazole ribonucleotide mutase n=2 Tax=Paraconexibacter sp. AEG42_29 TaxID=2997339 RepID=A0AAU7APB4_9ACTN